MVEIYKDARRQWRWRIKAENGRIVADCSEGYKSKAMCKKGFNATVQEVLRVLTELGKYI